MTPCGKASLGVLAAALVALAPRAARAEIQGRASLGIRSGAAYSSQLFLGDDSGPTAVASLSPGATFDLSFSPKLKLFSQGEADLEHYFAEGGWAYGASGEAFLQFRPTSWLYPELVVAAQGTWFREIFGPVDPTTSNTPQVTHSTQLTGGLALRAFAGTVEMRLLALVADRVSVGIQRYEEVPYTVQLSAGVPLGARVRLGATYRFTANTAADVNADGYAFTGHELAANLAWRPVDLLTLRTGVSFRRNYAYADEVDDFPRATLSLAIRLVGPLSAELAGSTEVESSQSPDPNATGTSSIWSVYGGLRAEGGPWTF